MTTIKNDKSRPASDSRNILHHIATNIYCAQFYRYRVNTMKLRMHMITTFFIFFISTSFTTGLCAPFLEGLESSSGIQGNGGAITGSLSFASGVNGNGGNFNGATSIRYTSSQFNVDSGSVSLWFKKTNSDDAGGILQIGTLGMPNSIGLFYNIQSNIYFEIKNAAGAYESAYSPGTLSTTSYTHIAAYWDRRGSTYYIKLFVNGRYADGKMLEGPISHNNGFLDIGNVGYYGNGIGIIDEVRFFDHPLSDPEVYAEYVHSANRYVNMPTTKPVSTGPVKLIGNTLNVEERSFTVKGVGYQPVPIGYTNSQATLNMIYSDPAVLDRDLPLLRNMGVNTVRLWGKLSDETLLNRLYNNGTKPIYAILTFEVPISIDYSDPGYIGGLEAGMRAYVNQFKNNPAVLAWAIGNENNLHYLGDMTSWYILANRLAQTAYTAEGPSYHPTIIINGYMLYFGDTAYASDDASLNATDLWGHNSYTGYEFDCYFDYYHALSAKPLILTEFGIDAYNTSSGSEYQQIHADWIVHQWEQIKANSLGGTVMEYSDEWWKGGSPFSHDTAGYSTDVQPDTYANEEWWGIMAIADNGLEPDTMIPRLAYTALKNVYTDPCFDNDNDGYSPTFSWGCTHNPLLDCNDNNTEVNPGHLEWCGTNYDDDCDGRTNEGCSTPSGGSPIYRKLLNIAYDASDSLN